MRRRKPALWGSLIVLVLGGLLLWPLSASGEAKAEAEVLSGGGGLALGWLFLDFTSLNEQLAAAELPQLQPGLPLLVLGGGGLGAHQRGWSLGGLLLYGERGSAWLERAVSFSLGLAGLLLEYGEPVSKELGLFLGGLFGLGRKTLEVLLYPVESFERALREPHGISLSRSFTAVGLYTGGEVVLPGLRLHLMVGYLWTVGVGNWRAGEGGGGREFPGPMEGFSAPLLQAIFWFEL